MGEARRRKLAGLPKFQKKFRKPETPPLRSPVEVEAALREDASLYGRIGAAIDFIHVASENALRQQTRRTLAEGK
jgi:hypothetical protein